MTQRIHDFLLRPPRRGRNRALPRRRSRRRARELYDVRQDAAGHAGVLRREGEPGAGSAALLASLGSCFDTASVPEVEMALAAGATPDRISFGNTIKKERDIARAYALGIRLFAVDCKDEVEKIARAAPGARVFCRILYDCAGAEWPLSRKFGCEPEMAPRRAGACTPAGPGSPRRVVPRRLAAAQREGVGSGAGAAAMIFRDCAERGISLNDGQPGRWLPDQVPEGSPGGEVYGLAIFRALRKHFGNRIPETIIEPGRGMVGNAGMIEAEVVLISKKSEKEASCAGSTSTSASSAVSPRRWTSRSATRSARRATATEVAPCVLAGPTCELGRRDVREDAVPAPGQPRDRRQGADRGHGCLHVDVLVGRLQRPAAAEDVSHLIESRGTGSQPPC